MCLVTITIAHVAQHWCGHMFKPYKVTVETEEYYVVAEIDVDFDWVDDSFDHEFGTKNQGYYEPTEVHIYAVRNAETGEKITSIPNDIKKLIIEEGFKKGRNE